nr:MAG TPA: hypothetical protein [Caudoviricetes sp.]
MLGIHILTNQRGFYSYSHIFHCSSCKVSSYFSSSSCGTSRAATLGLVSGFRATYIANQQHHLYSTNMVNLFLMMLPVDSTRLSRFPPALNSIGK